MGKQKALRNKGFGGENASFDGCEDNTKAIGAQDNYPALDIVEISTFEHRRGLKRVYKEGAAYYMYKDKFLEAPANKNRHLSPAQEVSPEVLNWIRSRNIKRAKGANHG
jgi:hypothetical protein